MTISLLEDPTTSISGGMRIRSFDSSSGSLDPRRVIKRLDHAHSTLWRVVFDDGAVLRVTRGHSLRAETGWKRADALVPGDNVQALKEGRLAKRSVIEVAELSESEPVYNLVVERDFTFIPEGVVVHSFTRCRTAQVAFWICRGVLQRFAERFFSRPRRFDWISPLTYRSLR